MTKTHLSLALSLAIHLAVFGLFAIAISWERDQPISLGSEELDVELLAPRLAPPIKTAGHEGRVKTTGHEGRVKTPGHEGRVKTPERGARSAETPDQTTPMFSLSEGHALPRVVRLQDPSTREQHRPQQNVTPREPRAAKAQPQQNVTPQEPRAAKAMSGSLPVVDRKAEILTSHIPQELPQTVPLEVLTSMTEEMNRRQVRHQRALEVKRAQHVAVEQELSRLKASQGQVTRINSRSSKGIPSRRAAASSGGRSALAGVQPRYGLKFYLSGRRVADGKVVRPPEPIHIPAVKCKISNPSVTPATVRLLVDMQGKVRVAYLKHTSSSKRFDRCALRHSKAITFKPGRDQKGIALDVWIHLRVEPSLITAQL